VTDENADRWPSLTANKDRPEPFGWIQWKGTDVCADIHCACGALMHIDADFLYHIQCPYCQQVYECSGFIDLHPLTFTPDNVQVLPKNDHDLDFVDDEPGKAV